MSLVNVITILLQQCPLGGFELGRFAMKSWMLRLREYQKGLGLSVLCLYLNPGRNMDLLASTEQRLRMER